MVLEGFHALKHALRFGAVIEDAVSPEPGAVVRLALELAPELAGKFASIVRPLSHAALPELGGGPARDGSSGAGPQVGHRRPGHPGRHRTGLDGSPRPAIEPRQCRGRGPGRGCGCGWGRADDRAARPLASGGIAGIGRASFCLAGHRLGRPAPTHARDRGAGPGRGAASPRVDHAKGHPGLRQRARRAVAGGSGSRRPSAVDPDAGGSLEPQSGNGRGGRALRFGRI